MLESRWSVLLDYVATRTLPSAYDPHYERILLGSSSEEVGNSRTLCQEDVNRLIARLRAQYDMLDDSGSTKQVALMLFCYDVFVCEQNKPDNLDTLELITSIIEYELGIKKSNGGGHDRDITKLRNICNTGVKYLYHNKKTASFDLEMCCEVHRSLMNNLLPPDLLGRFRTKWVGSTNGRVFLDPKLIEKKLQELLIFTRKVQNSISKKENPFDRFMLQILLGSFFVEEFLIIHPFKNGNGRTARILFSLLLSDSKIQPISFFANPPLTFSSKKQYYIDSLEKSRQGNTPVAIVRYILESVVKYFDDLIFLS